MTNIKATKRALGSSVLALFLCFAMLLGTTFAWFTDSVTSANNIITAGNLDVELEYKKIVDGKIADTWATVNEETKLFDEKTLWEPGHAEVVYLKVSNLGTLALKYQLSVTVLENIIGYTAENEMVDLTKHLVFKVVDIKEEPTTDYDAREDVVDTDDAIGLNNYLGTTKALDAKDGANDEDYVALIVYMPETVGNEANYRGEDVPYIKLGVDLFATQVTYEEDSFDEMYDKDAAVGTVNDAEALMAAGKDVVLLGCNAPNSVLNIPADYTGKVTLVNCALKSVQAEGDANIVIYGSVVVDATGSTENGSAITANGVLNISGTGNLTAIAADLKGAFGIGGMKTTKINIEGVTILKTVGGFDYEVGTNPQYYKDAPEGGAAIGSGFDGAVITLKNVVVNEAIGGSKAAGIGARYWTGVTVNIENSIIAYVEGGVTAAGIGGSRVSGDATESGVTINITNSNIKAVGGAYGAGIGSGYDTHCASKQPLCTINITDSAINAKGGKYAAGVGTGYHNAALAGEIKNSVVNAVSGDKFYKDEYTQAQDIGFGVVDLTREGQQADSKIVYNGTAIKIATNIADSTSGLSGNASIYLKDGNYTLPAVSGGDVTVSGSKNTVITVNKPNFSGSNITLNGVTVKGSGYATGIQHVNNVTYNNATIVGEMCLYGEKVVFNNCNFELNGKYIWTYGAKEVEFNNCTFDTTGKAILVYNEGAGASKVTVKNCVFNATEGAKAGAIANQNCAAIEIDNFQNSGKGAAHVVITEGNTYSDNFSGEWRIKNYVNGNVITVNGVAYNQIAVDGKLMTIDASKNVTVAD